MAVLIFYSCVFLLGKKKKVTLEYKNFAYSMREVIQNIKEKKDCNVTLRFELKKLASEEEPNLSRNRSAKTPPTFHEDLFNRKRTASQTQAQNQYLRLAELRVSCEVAFYQMVDQIPYL